jgi:hypothetical protein
VIFGSFPLCTANSELIWRGNRLALKGRTSLAVEIVPDDIYPGMWRIKTPGGYHVCHGQPHSGARRCSFNPA